MNLARNDFDAVAAYAERRVREEMKHSGAEVVAIAIVDASGSKLLHVYGRDDVGVDSHFRVGSLSKLMTSLTALSLRDDGKLDLDAPIERTLPWFSIKHRFDTGPITARLLMTHHAGLPSNIVRGMYGSSAMRFEDHAHLAADESMVTPAGTIFNYSDLGFTILGTALEAAGRAPFAQLAKERVFEPLGLAHTSFEQTKDVIPAIVDGARVVENPPMTVPANGLVTTPRDLASVASALLRKDGPLRARFDEVMTPSNATALDLDWRTGFGINENDAFAKDVGPIYWHSGQTLAFTAELVVCPSANVGVVVMTNTREAVMLPSLVAWDVMSAAIAANTGKRAGIESPVRASSFSQAELDSFAGMYPTEYGAISLHRDGDVLRGRAFDEAFELVPTQQRTFLPRVLALGAIPVDVDLLRGIELSFDVVDGQHALISHQRGLRVLRGVRVPPPATIPAAWRARTGHWTTSPEERGDDQITVNGADLFVDGDGFLMARIFIAHSVKPLLVPLVPLDDDTAVTAGIGRYLGETMRISHDANVEHMHVVGYSLSRAP